MICSLLMEIKINQTIVTEHLVSCICSFAPKGYTYKQIPYSTTSDLCCNSLSKRYRLAISYVRLSCTIQRIVQTSFALGVGNLNQRDHSHLQASFEHSGHSQLRLGR